MAIEIPVNLAVNVRPDQASTMPASTSQGRIAPRYRRGLECRPIGEGHRRHEGDADHARPDPVPRRVEDGAGRSGRTGAHVRLMGSFMALPTVYAPADTRSEGR